MENPSWLFVIATAIAVVGIVIIFKQLISRVHEQGEKFESKKELASFLMKLAMVEGIPIVMIAFGMMQIMETTGIDYVIPLILIFCFLLFGLIQIFLTRQQVNNDPRTPEQVKRLVSGYSILGAAFASAFPIISIALIFMTQEFQTL
ncbi:hypothetical protein [Desmospora profundinema]|uniref:Ribose/xylose/arabinose/galactoside ABC-type transport system permease subunit n=1 Tax=Desmospora profundinema TaxID=1571184 RepID=A0ABU1IP65_9BACL|nr:hypothetical protein [Desmospora profundinema]MDR6226188.1 ribose/xylose/arabinose/galactoside ABC-type transport system permease subunit [Desmospora profundinema]